MSHLFQLEITTSQGSATSERRANSLQQISDLMPSEVKYYQAKFCPLSENTLTIDDAALGEALTDIVTKIAQERAMWARPMRPSV